MEQHAQDHIGPSEDARKVADAVKRIMMADQGELAERMDAVLAFPMMAGDNAMFFALTGKEPHELLELLDIDPRKYRRRTCGACHHANGMHEPDCREAN